MATKLVIIRRKKDDNYLGDFVWGCFTWWENPEKARKFSPTDSIVQTALKKPKLFEVEPFNNSKRK